MVVSPEYKRERTNINKLGYSKGNFKHILQVCSFSNVSCSKFNLFFFNQMAVVKQEKLVAYFSIRNIFTKTFINKNIRNDFYVVHMFNPIIFSLRKNGSWLLWSYHSYTSCLFQ